MLNPNRSAIIAISGIIFLACLFTGSILASMQAIGAEGSLDAAQIMKRSRAATLIRGAVYRLTFNLKDESGKKTVRTLESRSKLQLGSSDDRRYSRFVTPPDARGISTLLVEHSETTDDMWVFLPALRRVRRIIADDKKDSFMGTELSYGDVLGYPVNRWQHEITGETSANGEHYWSISSRPIDPATMEQSGYSHRVSIVNQRTFVTERVEVWDAASRPLKTIWTRNIEPVQGQVGVYIAREIEVLNSQTSRRTLITVDSFEPKDAIPDDQFTPAAMEQDAID